MKKLFVDMDGVLCVFNTDASIEEVSKAGYFKTVKPQEKVVWAVKRICEKEIDVYILSSVYNDDHSIKDKNSWLDMEGFGRYIPEPKRIYVPYAMDKAVYVETLKEKEDTVFLLDDFTKNLKSWKTTGEGFIGIKLYNGYNGTKGTWSGYSVMGNSPADCIKNTILGIIKYAA